MGGAANPNRRKSRGSEQFPTIAGSQRGLNSNRLEARCVKPQEFQRFRSDAPRLQVKRETAGDFSGDSIRDMNDHRQVAIGWRHRNGIVMVSGHPDQARRKLPVFAQRRAESFVVVPETFSFALPKIASGRGSFHGFRESCPVALEFHEHADIMDETGEEGLVDGILPIRIRDDSRGARRDAGVKPEIVRIEMRPEFAAAKELRETRGDRDVLDRVEAEK